MKDIDDFDRRRRPCVDVEATTDASARGAARALETRLGTRMGANKTCNNDVGTEK